MKFAHIADNHLGYTQYGLIEREKDFYNNFDSITDKIIEERPDFIIHSGDLFETSRPPTKALLNVQENLLKIKEANIPFYAIAGNHDIILRKNSLPPQVLFKKFGMKIIGPQTPYFIENDIFIGGTPYKSKYYIRKLRKHINLIENSSKEYNKRVLVLHQAIDKYLPYNYELELSDVPTSFNYYAMGHIHKRIIEDFGEGKLVYAGSPEIWKIDELGSYKKKGKGFYLVDMGGDLPQVDPVNIQLPREFIKENVEYSQLSGEIDKIKQHILTLSEKPLLNITVQGGNFNRSDVFEQLNNAFSDICLSLRPNFKSQDLIDAREQLIDGDALNPKKLLNQRLSEFQDPNITNLAISLLNEMSSGNQEQAEIIATKFYQEFYGEDHDN